MTNTAILWEDLYTRLGAPGSSDPTYVKIFHAYAWPTRAYHNLDHVVFCLSELSGVLRNVNWCDHPLEVELALWTHDAVYDPRASDNEERSALFTRQLCETIGFSQGFTDRTADLVLATTHRDEPDGDEVALILDIDLAILGRPTPSFDEYERNIRLEYSHVPDDQYAAGRTAVLRRFLDRPRIYYTSNFHNLYEENARINIERSIRKLA
jgi:predicted metal-dependent HD superfamily phosphohydrolase